MNKRMGWQEAAAYRRLTNLMISLGVLSLEHMTALKISITSRVMNDVQERIKDMHDKPG